MATLTYDAELMTQQVAAVAVPNSKEFVCANDENGNIMIFSLGTDAVFYLCKEDAAGSRRMVNLSAALKVNEAKVTAFDVVQNPSDLTFYIVVALENSTSRTELLVLKPFKPENVDLSDPDLDLSGLVMNWSGGDAPKGISGIYMSTSDKQSTYPETIIAYLPISQVSKSKDLARLNINSDLNGWSLASDLSLPEDAFKILAICPGELKVGKGVFALRHEKVVTGSIANEDFQDQLELVFTGTERPFNVTLECPIGANALATFVDEDGHTSLIVGGAGLTYFTAEDCLHKGSQGTNISDDRVFSGVQELYLSQTSEKVLIFASNLALGVGYAVTSMADLTQGISPTPLIPDGKGGSFSPVITQNSDRLQFVVANNDGALTLLQQDPKSGIWATTPLYTPSLNTNLDVQAYTVHITLLDQNSSPMVREAVLLSSTGWVDIIVNGRGCGIAPSGTPVLSDESGTVTLIIPTTDIASFIFTVGNVEGSNLFKSGLDIDPSRKVHEALGQIKTADDLKAAKLQTGGYLLEGSKASDDDLDQAAGALAKLHDQRSKLAAQPNGLRTVARLANHQPGSVRDGQSLGRIICGRNVEGIRSAKSIMDAFWDAWEWFTNGVTNIVSWAIEELEDAISFIVDIGGQVLRWAVTTIVEIGKVMAWVFEKVLEIAEKIIEWIGFLLDWGDIQDTHKSIVHFMNSALDSGTQNLETVADTVDHFFLTLETTIKEAIYPDKLTQQTASPSLPGNSDTEAQKVTLSSTKVNYSKYQFTHGGASTASTVVGSQSSDPLHEAWTDIIEPAISSLQKTVDTIGTDIVMLFSDNANSLNTGQVLEKLGADILVGIIDAIRAVVVGLIKLGGDIIKDFKGYINKEINIPIFSGLWKTFISWGTELSLLDGLALLLAIPVTIIYKIITNEAPADMTSLDYNDLVTGKVTDGSHKLSVNHFMSMTNLITHALWGALQVVDDISLYSEANGPASSSRQPKTLTNDPLSRFRPINHPLQRNLHSKMKHDPRSLSTILTDWRLGLGVLGRVGTFPLLEEDAPASWARWASWLLGCASVIANAAIRSCTVENVPYSQKAKALAATDAAIGVINFALVCTVNGMEYAEDYQNPAYTTMHVCGSVFDLVNTEASATAKFTLGVDKYIAEAVSYVSFGLSMFSTGTVQLAKLENGEYDWVPEYI